MPHVKEKRLRRSRKKSSSRRSGGFFKRLRASLKRRSRKKDKLAENKKSLPFGPWKNKLYYGVTDLEDQIIDQNYPNRR